MSAIGLLAKLGGVATETWYSFQEWRAKRKLERAKAKAARTERELEAISDDANRDRERCTKSTPQGTRCTRPALHSGEHR